MRIRKIGILSILFAFGLGLILAPSAKADFKMDKIKIETTKFEKSSSFSTSSKKTGSRKSCSSSKRGCSK